MDQQDNVPLPTTVDEISINDLLPNEILEHFLHKLTSEAEICAAKSVCRRWNSIVDSMVGHTVLATYFYPIVNLLKNETQQNVLASNLKDATRLNEYHNLGIRELTIGVCGMLIEKSMTETIKQLISTWENTSPLPFPHILKKLSCYEPIPPDFFNVIRPLITLSYLNLSLLSLSSTKPYSFADIGRLRCLTTLVISNTSAYPDFNSCSVTPNLRTLLTELDTPNLIHLSVSYPVTDLLHIEDDCTAHLMSFIKRHFTILTLLVEMCSPNQDIKGPTKEFHYPHTLVESMRDLGTHINLSSVTVKDNHLHSLRPSAQVKGWAAFMKEQRNLKTFQLLLKSSVELNEDVAVIIERNANTLESLSLSCFPCELDEENDISFVPVECRILSDCLVLQDLRVTDRLLNTMYLPRTLKAIFVDAMLTNEDSARIILSETGVLETIGFRDTRGGTPKGFGYGIPIESLTQLVNMYTSGEEPDKKLSNKVKRLIILAGCTDGKFPPEGVYNHDSIKPTQLCKRRPPTTLTQDLVGDLSLSEVNELLNFPRIDWQLNERGFYEQYEETKSNNKSHDV